MSSLQLELTNSDLGPKPNMGFVAEISRRDESGKTVPGELRRVTVTTSEPTIISQINPGNWEVRVFTPQGGVVNRDVTVGEGSQERVQVDIASKRRRPVSSTFAVPRIDGGRKTRSFGQKAVFPVFVPASLQSSSVEAGSLGMHDPVWGDWRLLGEWLAHPTQPLLQESFRVAPADSGPDAPREVSAPNGFSEETRTFAVAKSRGKRRAHFVATPWKNHAEPRHALIQIVERQGGGWTSHVSVDDPLYAGLIGYLAVGAASTAVELIQSSQAQIFGDYAGAAISLDLLREKRSSPLGACAAAYALVASADRADAMPWRPWVSNLAEWFDWIPDGAIIEARCRILAARTQEDLDACRPFVLNAIARGVPSYTVGIGWLLQILVHFDEDKFIQSAIALIRLVASKLDMAEPFTTVEIE